MESNALLADEQVIYQGKLHWGIFVIPGLLCFFAIGGIVGLLIIKHPIPAGLVFLAALAFTFPALLRYSSNGLILTNKRVIVRTGVSSRLSTDIALSKIEGVSIEQNVIGQLFNYGTIVIRGTGGGIEKFSKLSAPAEFSKQVHQQIGHR